MCIHQRVCALLVLKSNIFLLQKMLAACLINVADKAVLVFIFSLWPNSTWGHKFKGKNNRELTFNQNAAVLIINKWIAWIIFESFFCNWIIYPPLIINNIRCGYSGNEKLKIYGKGNDLWKFSLMTNLWLSGFQEIIGFWNGFYQLRR